MENILKLCYMYFIPSSFNESARNLFSFFLHRVHLFAQKQSISCPELTCFAQKQSISCPELTCFVPKAEHFLPRAHLFAQKQSISCPELTCFAPNQSLTCACVFFLIISVLHNNNYYTVWNNQCYSFLQECFNFLP